MTTFPKGSGTVMMTINNGVEAYKMRKFHLVRHVDVHGISGTGHVAEGVVFSDGTVAMRWLTATASSTFFNSVEDLLIIHGHQGATTVKWLEE